MGATPMGATPKSAQKAYEGNKRISLVSIVSIISKVYLEN